MPHLFQNSKFKEQDDKPKKILKHQEEGWWVVTY